MLEIKACTPETFVLILKVICADLSTKSAPFGYVLKWICPVVKCVMHFMTRFCASEVISFHTSIGD
jgi:hypothetical protein